MIVKRASKIREELEFEGAQSEPYSSMLIIGDLVFDSYILYKLKFDNCTFKGDIKFTGCIIKEELSFIETSFEGNILFDNVIFEKEVSFNGSKFGSSSEAYVNTNPKLFKINQSTFKDNVDFSSSFNMKVYFNSVIFEKYANFHGAEFVLFISCINCTFNHVDFMFSIFKDNVNISDSKFLGAASFEYAQFGKDIGLEYLYKASNTSYAISHTNNFCFDRSIFFEDTSFFRAKFFGNIDFQRIKFNDVCNFLGVRFVGNVSFQSAEFKSFAKFGAGSKIYGHADFSEAIFHEGAYFHDLEFGKKFKLARAKIENLMIRWNSITDHLEDNWKFDEDIVRSVEVFDKSLIPLYLSLIKNFNNLGFNDDADECYLKLREKKRKNLKGRSLIMDCLDYALFGYGIKWGNPLCLCLFTIATFLFIFFIEDNNFRINNLQALENATLNSVSSFLSSPYLDNHSIIIFSYAERFFGYIFMSCFLVTLAKKRLR